MISGCLPDGKLMRHACVLILNTLQILELSACHTAVWYETWTGRIIVLKRIVESRGRLKTQTC